jgi:hypothetical protein
MSGRAQQKQCHFGVAVSANRGGFKTLDFFGIECTRSEFLGFMQKNHISPSGKKGFDRNTVAFPRKENPKQARERGGEEKGTAIWRAWGEQSRSERQTRRFLACSYADFCRLELSNSVTQ